MTQVIINNDLNQTDEICLNFYSEYFFHVEENGMGDLNRYQQRVYLRGEELMNDVIEEVVSM